MREAYEREYLAARRREETPRKIREIQTNTVIALEEIRKEFGIGWAIYASAFYGRHADEWRAVVCEALRD